MTRRRIALVALLLAGLTPGSAAACMKLPVPPSTRTPGISYFIATTAKGGLTANQVQAQVIIGFTDAVAMRSGAAILVPWDYGGFCQPVPWNIAYSGPWSPPEGAAFYTGWLRSRDRWINGLPTVDIHDAQGQPAWHADKWRHHYSSGTGSLLTPHEFFDFFAFFPTRNELLEKKPQALRRVETWKAAHQAIAAREPARSLLDYWRRMVADTARTPLPGSDPRYDLFSARLSDFDTLSIDDPRLLNVMGQGWRELQRISAADRPEARRLHLQMYLRLLAAIERRGMDPAFRFVERPSMRTDPDVYREVRLPFGMSRNPIRDPVSPTDYELAIRNNHRFDVQVDLGRARESVILDIEQLVQDGFSTPGALRDFKEAIAVADFGDNTRNQLRSLVHSGAGKGAIAAQPAMDPKYELLVDHLDAVSMSISVTPLVDSGTGLVSALLYVPLMLIEPHSIRPDGSNATGAARIAKEDMLRILDVLDRDGFLASADGYYGERVANPQGPPPALKRFRAYPAVDQSSPRAEFHLRSFDENYGTLYIISPSWDKQLVPLLTELRRTISDSSAKALLTQLLAKAALKVEK